MGTSDLPDCPGTPVEYPSTKDKPTAATELDETCLCYDDRTGQHRKVVMSTAVPILILGRDPQADVALTWDRSVSRLHAVVQWLGIYWTIVDSGLSLNGTFVNGRRLTGRRRLQPGDSILIGDTPITFRGSGRSRQTETRDGGLSASPRPLTEAQRRVVAALCRPYRNNVTFAIPASNRQIAEELQLSEETVRTHLHALFVRLGVDDAPRSQKRAMLAQRAIRCGIVSACDR